MLFIDASRDFYSGEKQNFLRDQDLEKIIKTSMKREPADKYAYLATLEAIQENDYNLNIPRYVDTFEEEEEIDLQKVLDERIKLKEQLVQIEFELNGYLRELGYKKTREISIFRGNRQDPHL